jgi:type VI secretion system protein ImpK
MDEQVLTSKWNAREQWSREPLNIVLNQDPEGGVNFYRRMEGLRENQPEVKEIYLLCLALGFRGKYATEELRVQTKKIGELKMKVLNDIQSTTMDTAERLFPEAYQEAVPVEDEVEPAPRWWWWASAGVVVAALLIWVLLFWLAGSSSEPAVNSIRELAMRFTDVAAGPAGGA